MEKKMTAEELVQLLNGGGWWACGGHEMHRERGLPAPALQVVNASLDEETVRIATTECTYGISISPPTEIVRIDPWLIEIRCTYLRKQLRKEADGGGFVEVLPTVGVALRLSNPALEQVAKEEREKQERLEREERARREAKWLEELCRGFQEELTRKYAGKKIVGLEVGVGYLDLTLEDGSVMGIKLGGEMYEEMWVEVDNISLSDFEYRHPSY